eukprot:s3454_g4.t1
MQLDPVPECPPPDAVEEGFADMPLEELPFSAGIPPGETDGRAIAAKAGDRQGATKMSDSEWSSWARRWRKLIVAVLPRGEDEAAAWSDLELRKLCAALWRDFADPLEKEEGDDAAAARRCLGLFRAESRKSSDMESQRGAAPAEWAFVPGDDLLLLLGEGLVGITVEGVFVSKDGTVPPRLPFASAIFQTMM